jgi:hypothetical protein
MEKNELRERDGIAKLSRRTKSGGTFLHRTLLLALTRKPPPVFVLDLHLDRAVFFGPERTRRFAGRNTPLTAQPISFKNQLNSSPLG